MPDAKLQRLESDLWLAEHKLKRANEALRAAHQRVLTMQESHSFAQRALAEYLKESAERKNRVRH